MSFAQPAAWMWAALALPIILLYVLKIRMRRVPVSTTLFWQQVFEDRRPRAWWQRLRHLLSLALQLAFLLLLVAALSDPVLEWGQRTPRRTVLIVDSSASMQATDVEGGRFAEAVAKAGRLIDDLRDRDSMALITGGTQPTVRCGMTGHPRSLREALADLEVRDGPTCVPQAVELARRILAGEEGARIVVLSDGAFPGARTLAEAGDVSLIQVGGAADNVALTRFQVRRSMVDAVGYEILVEVHNFGRERTGCTFELSLDEALLDVVPLDLAPGERWTRVFEQTSAEGGRLEGRLDVRDALALDDRAVALLPRRRPLRLAVGGEPSLFLASVLDAQPLVEAEWIGDAQDGGPQDGDPQDGGPGVGEPGVGEPGAGATGTEDGPSSPRAQVFHQRVPSPLPAGPVLVIDPQESSALWEVGEALANPLVTQQDGSSPLMRYVELEHVFIPEARALRARGPAEVLAATLGEDPVYLRFDRPEGTVLVLGIPLSRTDLPLRTAFPILIANALAEFAGTEGTLRESRSTGEIARVPLRELGLTGIARDADDAGDAVGADGADGGDGGDGGEGARVGLGRELVLVSPGGLPSTLRARGEHLDLGPLDRCGLWTLRPVGEAAGDAAGGAEDAAGEREVLLAVNLADAAESDLRGDDALDPAPMPASAGFGGRPMWCTLVVVALLLSTLEWGLYHRRRVE